MISPRRHQARPARAARTTAPAHALVLSLLAVPLGCGSGGDASPGSRDGGASDGGGGTGGSGGADAAPGCVVSLRPVVPTSFSDVVYGPDVKVRVRGELTGVPGALAATWTWSITRADGSAVAATPVNDDPSLVTFPVNGAGSYGIDVEAYTGRSCHGAAGFVAKEPGGRVEFLRFRMVPPAASRLPAQETDVQVVGGTPTGDNKLVLSPGSELHFAPSDAAGGALPAYLRVSNAGSGITFDGRSGAGPFKVRLAAGDLFDVLVIPDGFVAPFLAAGKRPADLATTSFSLDAGLTVAGTVSDGSGLPVAGVRVALRSGLLPSTLGTTAADGKYSVRVRATSGPWSAIFVPPPGAGLPEALVPASPGLALGGAEATLDFRFAPGASASATLTVKSSDGAAAVGGTRVHLETALALAAAGTATVTAAGGPATNRVAVGRVRADAVVSGTGGVLLTALPRAAYRATVLPGPGATDAVTVGAIDLGAGDITLALTLSRRARLSGRLANGAAAAGVTVVAVDQDSDAAGAAIVATAGSDGQWEVLVDPDRTWSVRAVPAPGKALGRAALGAVKVGRGGATLADRQLPPGLLHAGTVVDGSSLQPVGGVVIQVYCHPGAPGCEDATLPMAETVSRSDGFFSVTLPDPGKI